MLDEKPNNDFHWKNKLGELENLAGETFNKEAAWDKLHERMQGKTRNKNAVLYGSAVACLVLALIISWIFLANKKEGMLVKNNSLQKQTRSSSAHLSGENNNDSSVGISSLSPEEKVPALPGQKSNKINPLFNHTIIRSKIFQDKKEKEESVVQKITNNAIGPVDTVISIVAILPEKIKLKVVHINELGDPVTVSPNIAKSHEHRSLVKFINREINTSLPSSGNTGFNIFKTKTPPSN